MKNQCCLNKPEFNRYFDLQKQVTCGQNNSMRMSHHGGHWQALCEYNLRAEALKLSIEMHTGEV